MRRLSYMIVAMTPAPETGQKYLVLHIDDEAATRILVAEGISSELDVEVASASNFDEGLSLARQRRPDLILLDVQMPGFDGVDTCQIFKRDFKLKTIPIVMVTGSPVADVEKALTKGANGYLFKPFDIPKLVEKVLQFIPRAKRITS